MTEESHPPQPIKGDASRMQAGRKPQNRSQAPLASASVVQGRVDSPQKVGDWLCIVVRCDHPGSPLSLHLSVPGKLVEALRPGLYDQLEEATLNAALPL